MGECVLIVRFSRNMADTNEQNDLPTIADDLVVTKYKMAAEIVNKVLKELVEQCKPEASVRELDNFHPQVQICVPWICFGEKKWSLEEPANSSATELEIVVTLCIILQLLQFPALHDLTTSQLQSNTRDATFILWIFPTVLGGG